MQPPSWPGPRRSIEALASRLGRAAVVAACIDLLAGRDVEDEVVLALGGPPARIAMVGGTHVAAYWHRVWALRGLLWLWDDRATATLVAAMSDESWRAREMAAKVAARNRVAPALEALDALRRDPVLRVRRAGQRAVETIIGAD
ncbi:HEAT repeat domain-containing protein [Amnibacterium sp. CER49]|uniref:HEAT repeat domain-containing protein n=1 Tax=Amnibacterium sp. CER49 TaxID=3039161 RepID=UPI002448CADC|nr:HEAT repeat domain-containing protein [Amnibacterium sp. CER49]MDH2443228.1 HEAT repeat domain-containing protein [Amnibacterium sp. CER49]